MAPPTASWDSVPCSTTPRPRSIPWPPSILGSTFGDERMNAEHAVVGLLCVDSKLSVLRFLHVTQYLLNVRPHTPNKKSPRLPLPGRRGSLPDPDGLRRRPLHLRPPRGGRRPVRPVLHAPLHAIWRSEPASRPQLLRQPRALPSDGSTRGSH